MPGTPRTRVILAYCQTHSWSDRLCGSLVQGAEQEAKGELRDIATRCLLAAWQSDQGPRSPQTLSLLVCCQARALNWTSWASGIFLPAQVWHHGHLRGRFAIFLKRLQQAERLYETCKSPLNSDGLGFCRQLGTAVALSFSAALPSGLGKADGGAAPCVAIEEHLKSRDESPWPSFGYARSQKGVDALNCAHVTCPFKSSDEAVVAVSQGP